MLTPGEALARVLALATPTATETVPLIEAAGRWSAAPVTARRIQPARDLSAMDGYAMRAGSGPWRVIGESAAGRPFPGVLDDGEAVRISTGAALPDGADAILMQEDAVRDGDILSLLDCATPRVDWIRRAGSDFSAGDILIGQGQALTAATIALAAIGGHGTLMVHRRLRIALLSTGDELVAPGIDPGPDRLPGSNGVMLAAMLHPLPVAVTDLGIVADARPALLTAIAQATGFDILMTTGGVSVGDHDLVRPCLVAAGAALDLWKVAMRPGKPLMAGRLGTTIVLGLPGNPASAFVTATLFLLPLIRRLLGAGDCAPPTIAAELAAPLPAVGARTDYVRARWTGGRLVPLPSGDSGVVGPLAIADALIVRPAGSPAIDENARVAAILLDR